MKIYESQYVILNKHHVKVATKTYCSDSWKENEEKVKKYLEEMKDCYYRNTYNHEREIKEE